MALTIADAGWNAMLDALSDLLDGGTMELQTSGDVEVATLALNATFSGAAASGSITVNAFSSDTSATGGTAAKCVFKSSGAATIITGTVTASGGGGDVELDNTSISAGATVSVNSGGDGTIAKP